MRLMPIKNREKRGQNLKKIKQSLGVVMTATLLQATKTSALVGHQVLGAVLVMEKKWLQLPLNKISSNS